MSKKRNTRRIRTAANLAHGNNFNLLPIDLPYDAAPKTNSVLQQQTAVSNIGAITGLPMPAPNNDAPSPLERGTSGLRTFAGFVTEAYNAQWTWPVCEPLIRRMTRSVPAIVMVRQAFLTWSSGIDMKCDLPDHPTDDDKRVQEAFYFMIEEDMEGGITKFKQECIDAPMYGWARWEAEPGLHDPEWVPPAYDKDSPDPWRSTSDDGLWTIRRLAYRKQSSWYRWVFDSRKHFQGMIQRDWPAYQPIYLPNNEALHIVFGDTVNPEGWTPNEACWRLERLLFGYEVTAGIGAEHSAGHMAFTKTATGALSSIDLANVANAAKSITSAQAGNYYLLPSGLTGELKDVPFAAGGTILDLIQHYNIMMLMVWMMSFLGLNTMTRTGSRAATGDISQMGVVNFNSMMAGFAEQFKDQIFKRWFKWNQSAFPKSEGKHRVRFTEVSKDYALTDLGAFITAYGNLFQMSDDDSKAIRNRSGFLPDALPENNQPPKEPSGFSIYSDKALNYSSDRHELARLLLKEESRHSRAREAVAE